MESKELPATTAELDLARETDTRLADIYAKSGRAGSGRDSAAASLARALGHRRDERLRIRDLLEEAEGNDHPNVRSARNELAKRTTELAELAAEAAPLNALYDEHRWSRFFLCATHGGHIHSSLHCSTTFASTEFSWLPELSGLSEAAAVAEYGAILCTVCYPSAPVDWTGGVNKKEAAAKEIRDAELAAKRAAKAEKAITAPDGSPLSGKYGLIATLVTANRELVDALAEIARWNSGDLLTHRNHDWIVAENAATADRMVEAIAAKTGEPAEEIRAAAETKAAAKRKREGF